MSTTPAKGFVCEQCVEKIKEPEKEISFFDQTEFVKSFCYLMNKLNAIGESKQR